MKKWLSVITICLLVPSIAFAGLEKRSRKRKGFRTRKQRDHEYASPLSAQTLSERILNDPADDSMQAMETMQPVGGSRSKKATKASNIQESLQYSGLDLQPTSFPKSGKHKSHPKEGRGSSQSNQSEPYYIEESEVISTNETIFAPQPSVDTNSTNNTTYPTVHPKSSAKGSAKGSAKSSSKSSAKSRPKASTKAPFKASLKGHKKHHSTASPTATTYPTDTPEEDPFPLQANATVVPTHNETHNFTIRPVDNHDDLDGSYIAVVGTNLDNSTDLSTTELILIEGEIPEHASRASSNLLIPLLSTMVPVIFLLILCACFMRRKNKKSLTSSSDLVLRD